MQNHQNFIKAFESIWFILCSDKTTTMSKSNEYQTKNQANEFPVFPCVPGKVQYKTPGLSDFKIRGLCKMVSDTLTFQLQDFTTCVQI